jgi:kynurenine formamidase
MDRRARTTFTDLTHPLTTGMPVYPGDPVVEITEVLTLPADGCSVRSLRLGSHSGTHVDAPAHIVPGGRTVDQVAPEELMGDAAVVHLPDLAPGERIDAEMLVDAWSGRAGQAAAGSTSGPGTSDGLPRIVLVATGWDRFWGTDDYPRHPVLTEDAASALVEAGVQVLGVDTVSPDGSGDADDADALAAHRVLLGADRLIIENLRGLTGLPQTAEFTALPLSIAGGDGAPVRAVARY